MGVRVVGAEVAVRRAARRFGDVVIVTGSRHWTDEDRLVYELERLCPSLVVEGGCPTGADAMARRWAAHYGVPAKTFQANWGKHGRRAGPLRNGLMLRSYPNAIVLAFPLDGPGTADCMRQARAAGMCVREVKGF
jgi:hypothetical protein